MVGRVVSITVTVWLQKALLLALSVALQVRVAENVPPQSGFVLVPVTMIALFVASQLLKAVGRSKVQEVPHSTVLLVVQAKVGGCASLTITRKEQLAVLQELD